MNKPKFTSLTLLSDKLVIDEINATEIKIFNLRFKKATRQNFKPHELKVSKKKLAQLKTLLNQRINSVKQKEESALNKTLAS